MRVVFWSEPLWDRDPERDVCPPLPPVVFPLAANINDNAHSDWETLCWYEKHSSSLQRLWRDLNRSNNRRIRRRAPRTRYTLSQVLKHLKNGLRFKLSYREFKGGNFFETQCRRHRCGGTKTCRERDINNPGDYRIWRALLASALGSEVEPQLQTVFGAYLGFNDILHEVTLRFINKRQ